MLKRDPTTMQSDTAYRRDLAHIHNAGFGMIAENAAVRLQAMLRAQRFATGHIVDLGCGGGLLAAELLKAGYDVTGYDLSPAMIDLARRHAPRGAFHVASFLDVELPPAVAVTAVGEIFCYLFDKRNAARPLAPLLRRIYKALAPGGVLLFDIATPGRVPAGGTSTFREGDDWVCLYSAAEDAARRRLTRRITSFCRDGNTWRRDDETHHLRLYDPQEVLTALRHCGFRPRATRRYATLKLPPGLIAFEAIKPRT